MSLDDLKDELGADSVEWADNPYEQKPSIAEGLEAMLADMQAISADMKRAVVPSSVLGELLDERNKHLSMLDTIGQWMDKTAPVVEAVMQQMSTEKDA